MPRNNTTEGFWDFSVRTYRTPGVPDACLSLQNDYGADVNMLMYCCWIGANLGQFDAGLFAEASRFSALWAENVVIPLRSARTWMKTSGCTLDGVPTKDCMRLRDKVKSVEFAAEKMQEQVLESLVSVDQLRGESEEQILNDVSANLVLYAGYSGFDICDDVRSKFAIIIAGAFPHWNRQSIDRVLEL